MARVDDFLTDRSTLTLVDLSNRKTHEANHNSRELIEILAEFRTARHRLVDHVGKFQPALFARSRLHPRLSSPCARGSFVFCCGARRPSRGKNLGNDRSEFPEGGMMVVKAKQAQKRLLSLPRDANEWLQHARRV